MIIPALDIIDGTIVRLYQGNYHAQSKYGNPISILKQYIQQDVTMIHLVDLTGAQNPENRQTILINELIKITSSFGVKIQVGGGIRNITEIETLLKLGANRIVLGSVAIIQPKIVKKWFEHFDPDSLVLALDIHVHSKKNRKVSIHAWQQETNKQLEEVIEDYNTIGLKHVLCTDIKKDGTLLGSNIDLYKSICRSWPNILFQASGGISNLTEISQLKCSGVNSIIIGRAFLEKKFTIHEAISCWQNASSLV